jgi:outer membrane lipoprotein-sorting protein
MFKPITMAALLVILAASVPAAVGQDKPRDDDAKKLFQKMEDSLSNARTLRCDLKLKFDGTGEPGGPFLKRELSGSLALAKPDRIRFELRKTAPDPSDFPGIAYWLTISDGKRELHEDSGTPKPLIRTAGRDDTATDVAILLARSGLLLVTFPLPPVEARDLKNRFPVSEFKLRPLGKVGDVMAERLDYRFDVKGQKQPNGDDAPLQASVWLDPKTSLPLKRTVTWKLAGVQVISIIEEYQNMVIDEKIDPKTFHVPAE